MGPPAGLGLKERIRYEITLYQTKSKPKKANKTTIITCGEHSCILAWYSSLNKLAVLYKSSFGIKHKFEGHLEKIMQRN